MAAEWEGTVSSPRRVLLPAALLVAGVVIGLVAVPAEEGPQFAVIPSDAKGPPIPAAATEPAPGGSWTTIGDGPLGQRKDPAMVWTGEEVLVWGGVRPDGSGLRDGATYDPGADRWRRLPPAPQGGRAGSVVAWTGDVLLVWGGEGAGGVRSGGLRFDPATDRWRRLPAGPLSARRDAEAAWTGRELVVWGGTGRRGEALRDGARFDPVTGHWRRLPPGPLARGPDSDVEVAAVDGGVMFWASSGNQARAVFYDLSTNRWRELWTPRFQPATHPTFLSIDGAVLSWGWASIGDHGPLALKFTTDPDWWTTIARPPVAPDAGRSLLGSDGVAVSWSRAGAGIWYDALDDQWHRMTPSPQPVAAGWAEQVWADDRLVVWHAEARRGAAHRAVVWQPSTSWQPLPAPPATLAGDVSAVWTGWLRDDQQALVWGEAGPDANAGAAFDPALSLWESMPPAPLPPRTQQAVAWSGSELLVLGGRPATPTGASGPALRSGAAYDPRARAWRRMPNAPVRVTRDALTVGGQSVYAAGPHRGALRLARYSPRPDRWHLLPPPPANAGVGARPTVWWTGRELWMWSVRGDTAWGAAWDPADRSWRWLPALRGLSGQVSVAGGYRRLFVMDGAGTIASLGLGTDGWRLHPLGPRFGAAPALVWAGRSVVAYDPDARRLAALDPRASAWAELPPPPVPHADTARLLWTGRHLIVLSGGAAAMLGS